MKSKVTEGGITMFYDWLEKLGSDTKRPSLSIKLEELEVTANRRMALQTISNHKNDDLPIVCLLSGTSESGKSHAGQQLLREGVASRIKLLRVVRELQERGSLPQLQTEGKMDPNLILDTLSGSTDPSVITIIEQMATIMSQPDVPIAMVETIKHPALIENFRTAGNIRTFSIFVDAYLENRVKRESNKISRPSTEVRAMIAEKDAKKQNYGNDRIAGIADLLIINNGSIDIYSNFITALGCFFRAHTRQYEGEPFEYS